MATYKELLAQKALIDAQIEEIRMKDLGDQIRDIRARIAEYSIPPDQLYSPRELAKVGAHTGRRTGNVPVKYRDVAGNEWTGRGRAPRWLTEHEASGGTREALEVGR